MVDADGGSITLESSREDKKVIWGITDTMTKEVVLPGRLNSSYLFGNLGTYGIGYVVDLTTKKRFGYPKAVTLYQDKEDNWKIGFFKKNIIKNKWYLHVGIPQFNFFSVPESENSNKVGFLGFKVGIQYYYTVEKSVEWEARTAINYLIPVPIPLLHSDINNKYILGTAITHNWDIDRWTLGAGLGYTVLSTQEPIQGSDCENCFYNELDREDRDSHLLTLHFPMRYQIGRHIYTEFKYSPSIITFMGEATGMNHFAQLGLYWRFGL